MKYWSFEEAPDPYMEHWASKGALNHSMKHWALTGGGQQTVQDCSRPF